MKPGAVLANMARGPLVVDGRSGRGLGEQAAGRGRDGRDRDRAVAAGEPALGPARGDHHAARGRAEQLADRQHDASVLSQLAAAGRPACRW